MMKTGPSFVRSRIDPKSSTSSEQAISRLGEKLIDEGIVSAEQVSSALEIQRKEGNDRRRIGEILANDLKCDRDAVFRTIAKIYGFPDIDLSAEPIDEYRLNFVRSFLDSIGSESAKRLASALLLPFKIDYSKNEAVVFLTEDPTDPKLNLLLFQLKVTRYELAYAPRRDLEQLFGKIQTPQNEFLQLIEEISGDYAPTIEQEETEEEITLDLETNRSVLTNLVEGCLVEAVRQNASDVHILPRSNNKTEFWFRVDGKLRLWHAQENFKPETISAIVKDRTRNVDRFVWDSSQDGFIQRQVDNATIRFRVSIMPIVAQDYKRKFESIVIRVLDDRKVITDLTKLGFHKQARTDFVRAIEKPQGMVILTGPTGSGKSTTLLAALFQVMTPEKNVLTIEDPVEYMIRDARQIKLSNALDFEGAIRGILRHDPDIVMVGEMRDKLTAEIAIKLANTGHLTFSTLHTNDATSAVSRLYKMGIEPFLIATAMNIIVAQRLLRTLCKKCKRPTTQIDPAHAKLLGFTDQEIAESTFYEAVGCDECNNGYKGRCAIHEALFFSRDVRHLILNSKADIDEEGLRELAVSEGMYTLRASGRERIKEGITSLEEVVATTSED
ncbi:MAG: ATPase, T2SS/T4P/T4SS family [bacterium]|nr:ATPase, T2SS/T4P/T4SS family [bacterium]